MSALVAWLSEFFIGLWGDFVEFLTYVPLVILAGFLGAIAALFEAIPVPAFLAGGLGPLMAGVDPGILYFLDRSGIAPALSLLGAGLSFRLLRKIFTLGQW